MFLGQVGVVDIDDLASELIARPDLARQSGFNVSESEDEAAAASRAATVASKAAIFGNASSAPLFELRPHHSKGVSKKYVAGMLSRAEPGPNIDVQKLVTHGGHFLT